MEGGVTHEHHEQQPAQERPRIYVASLSDYNNGLLHGTWLDASQDLDDLHSGISSMLERSPTPGAEEWAIHDYDNFGPVRIDEYEQLDVVHRIAVGIRDHGEPFAHWASIVGVDQDDLDRFEDAYRGTWENDIVYVESLLDELGVEEALDNADIPLRAYIRIDTAMLAQDLRADLHFSAGGNGVHVFEG